MFKVGDIVKRADGLEQDTLYVPNDDRARGEVLDANYTYGLDKWVLVRWNMRPYGCVDERAEMWILEQEIELADMDLKPEEGYLYKIRFKTVEEMLQVEGADIEVRKKKWDDDAKQFVYDTPDGKLTCTLNAVLYENGQPPKRVRWERSAAFTEQACNGYWSKFPRIIDGVWEVKCTNPGTKEIKFSWFPVMGADLTSYPLPEGVKLEGGQVVYENAQTTPVNAPTSPAATSSNNNTSTPTKYWED